jgi:hypothetical protein
VASIALHPVDVIAASAPPVAIDSFNWRSTSAFGLWVRHQFGLPLFKNVRGRFGCAASVALLSLHKVNVTARRTFPISIHALLWTTGGAATASSTSASGKSR